MVTQPAPLDKSLTVHREAALRQLAEYTTRLLQGLSLAAGVDARAYADLLTENVTRVGGRAGRILRSAIHPSEQERVLAVANPWLGEIRARLEERARPGTRDDADGGRARMVTEWVFTDADLTRLIRQADQIVAETVRIEDARRVINAPKAPAILYEDKLEDLRDRLMPERCLGPWIKPAGIRQWLDHCDARHAAHCQLSDQSRRIFAHHPAWLVDVARRRLVPARPGQRYLALSYVWGPRAAFQTLRSNVEALQRDGALAPFSSEPGGAAKRPPIAGLDTLARTVADVIELADRLGEPYLWVDALCIVQDDDLHKQEHLAHMGSIYANAYATIVVANGPAHRGLSGLRDVTPPMDRARAGAPYSPSYVRRPGTMAAAVQRHTGAMQRSAWNQRAWTFQEQIFSRRLIVLDDEAVAWECHCNVWLEGVAAVEARCARNTAVVAQGFSFHVEPTFRDYADHVRQYNRRRLSYPEDAMDAFAGILTVLRTTFLGGFVCCLPVMFFDTALLWYNEGMVEARVPRRRRQGHGGLAPTWTWAAYDGTIAFPDFSAAKEGVRPLVRWQYCRGDVKTWSPVLSLEKQQPEKKFPTATELQELVEAMSLEDGGLVRAAEPEVPEGTGAAYHHLLHARPERAVFNVLEYYGDEGVPLVGASGECVGVLTPSKKLGSRAVDAKTVIPCELVAVSESFINGLETYNVLWIEKKGEVYVRKGVGRILKSDWISQKPERMDLVLV